jgi:hypothetical protein
MGEKIRKVQEEHGAELRAAEDARATFVANCAWKSQ